MRVLREGGYEYADDCIAVGRINKIIECCPGTEIECSGFTNTCPVCGKDYNWAGQQLAPRSQWGEETNETAEEILAIDSMTTAELFDTVSGEDEDDYDEEDNS